MSKTARGKLQQIQRSFLIYITKAYKTVSHEALSAIAGIMLIEQAMHLYIDIREISRGIPTNAVITELKKIEIPTKIRGIHPKDNHIPVDLSGSEGNANVIIYTDGSKTENRVGASMVAVKDSRKIHINTQTLSIICTVFQAELYGIIMALDWIQSQGKKTSSYAINVDSKVALLAIENKHITHPLAVATRLKTIELKKLHLIHLPPGQRTRRTESKQEGRLLGQNSCELQYYHRLRRNPNHSRKAVTGRLLHKNLERNVRELYKFLPH